jgi:hypothetical protein
MVLYTPHFGKLRRMKFLMPPSDHYKYCIHTLSSAVLFFARPHGLVGMSHGVFLPTKMTACGEVSPISEIYGVEESASKSLDYLILTNPLWKVWGTARVVEL